MSFAQIIDVTLKEKRVCEAIKAAIAARKTRLFGYREMAEKIGTSYDRLNNVANARTAPDVDLVNKLRELLNLPADWPYDPEWQRQPQPGQMVSLAGTPMVRVPVAGSVAAGEGYHNVDPEDTGVYVPARMAIYNPLGWIVEGDSMMPLLHEHDVAVFREHRRPRDGYVYLVRASNGDRCKLMRWKGEAWVLQSLNPMYPEERYEPGAQLVGMLIGWYRIRGTRETMDLDPEGITIDA